MPTRAQIGLSSQCGVPTANWVPEFLPIGWVNIYDQVRAREAFNISPLASGT